MRMFKCSMSLLFSSIYYLYVQRNVFLNLKFIKWSTRSTQDDQHQMESKVVIEFFMNEFEYDAHWK